MCFQDDRIKKYNSCSKSLFNLTDDELNELMQNADPFHKSMWSTSASINFNGTQIFVKKIPLTDLERLPDNIQSTSNFFNLPLYYQYGVGSAGFGVWRELKSHIMTTDWVLLGKCPCFPLLYHWRTVLSNKSERMSTESFEHLERDVAYWENSDAICKRLLASHNASAYIVLFLEYIPQNIYQWLSAQLTSAEDIEQVVTMVDETLKMTTDFMQSQDFIHFDAHFENILTDGKQIYFSDFGLSLSKTFDLSSEEIAFFEKHRTYDRYSTIVNLLHCITTCQFGKDNWEMVLKECFNGKHDSLHPAIKSIVEKYASVAFIMDEFYQSLIKKTKLTPYPKDKLEKLLRENAIA